MAKKKFIPPKPVPLEILAGVVPNQKEHEERAIREYVEAEAREENVVHLELVKTEAIYDRKIEAWEVWTESDRYWVITNPTNLYSQSHFESLDYTISFHLGVTLRMSARQHRELKRGKDSKSSFASAWRRLSQAVDSFELADEAEDFQAIGMRCRECLLDFVRKISDVSMLPENTPEPKKGDFVKWSQIIAQKIAAGPQSEAVRGYLTSTAKSTWELVSWLTHARNAIHYDADLAIDATDNVLSNYEAMFVKYKHGVPSRCPKCSSYKIILDYLSDLDIEISLCESCGWSNKKEIIKKNNHS